MAQNHTETCTQIIDGSQGFGLALARVVIAEGFTRIVLTGRDQAKGDAAEASGRSRNTLLAKSTIHWPAIGGRDRLDR